MKKTDIIIGIILSACIVFLLFVAFGCSSVKKTQSSHNETKDSVQLKKADSTAVSTSDSVSKNTGSISSSHTDSSQYHRTITIDVADPDSCYSGSNSATAADYAGTDSAGNPKPKIKNHRLVLDVWHPGPAVIDLGDLRPTRISITESGNIFNHDTIAASFGDSTATHSRDSTAGHSSDSTRATVVVQDTSSSKKKTGIPFFICLAGGVALLIWLLWWLKRKRQ